MPKYIPRRNRLRTTGRLRKRWYLNASANLPFVGKTSLAMGSSKAKRSIINIVRNGLEDPLHKLNAQSLVILQDTVYSLNLTGNIPQGDTDNNRSGDTIHIDAIKLGVAFTQSNAVNPSVTKHFRLMIVKQDTDLYTGSDNWGSSLGSTSLFQTTGAPLFLAKNNAKLCTVLYDKVCTLQPQSTATASCMFQDIIRLGQKFTYKTGTNYGKHSNLYAIIVGYEFGATTGSTTIGAASWTTDLIFKDSK